MPRNKAIILIVDDRDTLIQLCRRSLGDDFDFHRVSSGREAQTFLEKDPAVDLALVDRDFSHTEPSLLLGPREDVRNEGLHVLRWLRQTHPGISAIMVTGYRDQDAAMEATALGADFLAWEDLIAQPALLRARIERALEHNGHGARSILAPFRETGIVVESDAFARTLLELRRAIDGRGPILLLGETGTGKDTLAFAVHALSGDSARPYVSVNTAALNPNLIESELFGHARGAYTGASQASLGKLRAADGGTLFLNEVAELPLDLQSKLLTALEHNTVVPVGDVRGYPAHFRLVVATSRDLLAEVQAGRFRQDLYHRIAWHTVRIPPLRERQEDIPVLVRTFLRDSGQGQEGHALGIADEAVHYLCTLPWQGNIRELRGVLEAAASIAREMITLGDVREIVERRILVGSRHAAVASDPESGKPGRVSEPAPAPLTTEACEELVFGDLTFRDLTARYFEYLKRRANGRLPEVARRAGIGKATVYEWAQRFGTPPEE